MLAGCDHPQHIGSSPIRPPQFFRRSIMTPIKGLELAKACARAANEMQAEEIRIWDLRGLSSLTDFMIVCSGNSMPHLRAILRDIGRIVEDQHGVRPHQAEGRAETRWVVLDFIDVMVHVMHQELRDLYALEKLWGDAKEIEWNDAPAAE
jgi:ribosome-associated protein